MAYQRYIVNGKTMSKKTKKSTKASRSAAAKKAARTRAKKKAARSAAAKKAAKTRARKKCVRKTAAKKAAKTRAKKNPAVVRKERTYSDPSAAHEFALRLKMKGHTGIRISKDRGKHKVTWSERDTTAKKRNPGSPPSGWGNKGPYKDDKKGVTTTKWKGLTIKTKYVTPRGTYESWVVNSSWPSNKMPGLGGRTRAESLSQTKSLFPKLKGNPVKKRAKKAKRNPRGGSKGNKGIVILQAMRKLGISKTEANKLWEAGQLTSKGELKGGAKKMAPARDTTSSFATARKAARRREGLAEGLSKAKRAKPTKTARKAKRGTRPMRYAGTAKRAPAKGSLHDPGAWKRAQATAFKQMADAEDACDKAFKKLQKDHEVTKAELAKTKAKLQKAEKAIKAFERTIARLEDVVQAKKAKTALKRLQQRQRETAKIVKRTIQYYNTRNKKGERVKRVRSGGDTWVKHPKKRAKACKNVKKRASRSAKKLRKGEGTPRDAANVADARWCGGVKTTEVKRNFWNFNEDLI